MNSRFVPKIEKPCPANWDEMQGDEKRRFCEHCQLHVHNLSAMTAKEQMTLLESRSDRVCVSYVANPNATPVSSDDTWLRLHSSKTLRAMAAMFVAMSSMFLSACRTTGMIQPKVQPPPQQQTTANDQPPVFDGKRMAGGIMPPPRPWWKRLLFLD